MIFTDTALHGAFVLELEKREDSRGFFARTFCQKEFEAHGLDPAVAQCNIAFNKRRGTLRGLHFQRKPYEEAKLVRCTRGAVYDVIVDLRRDSPTFKRWIGVELSADNRRMLYVPPGFGHSYQTLEDNAEVLYLVSQFYAPDHASGVRYDDPAFAIRWPLEITEISEQDRRWPDFH